LTFGTLNLVVEIGISYIQRDYTNGHNWVFLLKWCILFLGAKIACVFGFIVSLYGDFLPTSLHKKDIYVLSFLH